MDCTVIVEDSDTPTAKTKVLNGIKEGDMVVTDDTGIKTLRRCRELLPLNDTDRLCRYQPRDRYATA